MSLSLSTRAQTRHVMMAEIQAYLSSLSDYNRWQDFFESSTGKTMLDLLTGISELLLYKLEIRSLDSYLPTALSKSAAYLLAQMVGYNPNRKSHGIGTVRIHFQLVTPVPLVLSAGFKFDNEIPLSLENNVSVPAGTSMLIVPVIQGEWVVREFNMATGNLLGNDWEVIKIDETDFQIDQQNIYVEVDNQLLVSVQRIELVNEKSVMVRTDYKGGTLLLFGDGTFGYRLRPSTNLRVRYLRTQGRTGFVAKGTDLGSYVIANNQVIHATVESSVQGGTNEDDINKVKYLASRFFQTQGRAVTAYDYEACLLSFPGAISAKAIRMADQCCTIGICVLKDTVLSTTPVYPTDWSDLEVNAIVEYMEDYKILSSRLVWHQPIPVDIQLSISVVVPPMFVMGDLEERVRTYIKENYCYALGGRFLSTKVIDDVTDVFPEIKRSYILEVNGQTSYPDINLLYYEFFRPTNIVVTSQIEI